MTAITLSLDKLTPDELEALTIAALRRLSTDKAIKTVRSCFPNPVRALLGLWREDETARWDTRAQETRHGELLAAGLMAGRDRR